MKRLSLANEVLDVELAAGKPVVARYTHKPTGLTFAGGTNGTLGVNGRSVPWNQWKTNVAQEKAGVRYRLALPGEGFSFTWEFALRDNALDMRIVEWDDPQARCRSIEWVDLPLVVADDPTMQFWRLGTTPPDMSSGGKMWQVEQEGSLAGAEPETAPRDVIHGALWNGRLCVSVESNYPLFPTRHQVTAGGRYAISLNPYRHRVRTRTIPLLEARVVFLDDLNGDAKVDLSDYRLWLNRRLPDGDPLYCRAIWYKIFMDSATTGIRTTFPQAEEIVRAIHNITDGLPQVAYLIGCQAGGHDGSYPTLDAFNDNLGTPEDLRRLSDRCREVWNTVVSYHANLDDAHKASRDWDEEIVIPSGSPGPDALGVPGSVCHTRDTETGRVFRRLEAMRKAMPFERTIHFDNTRITNTITRPHPDGIGVLEELVCGLMPVADWLRERGITITTEGSNGIPIEPTLLFSGFWHHDVPDGARQIYHRKIMGGGRGDHFACNSTMDFGLCNAIHHDFSYKAVSKDALGEAWWAQHASWMKNYGDVPLTLSLTDHFAKITDWIYRGTLLYQFYLEREMTAWEPLGQGVRMRFGDGVIADVCVDSPESLYVTWGDVLIATRDDRFIPRGAAIYAYSRTGGERDWALPEAFGGRNLQLFTLTRDGRGPAPEHAVEGKQLRLTLEPGVPVKIMQQTNRET